MYSLRKHLLSLIIIVLLPGPTYLHAQRTAPTPPPKRMFVALQHLAGIGYWVEQEQSINAVNKQAIIAFQKVNRLPRTGILTEALVAAILNSDAPRAGDSMQQLHIEIDLNRQVLFVVDERDHVQLILPVSTGNGKYFETPDLGGRYALTPRGHFKVYLKISGWRKSKLGLLFDPMYVRGGVAIHGAQSVPPIPASHGCIRIPMFAAPEMYKRTPIGTPVLIYGENPKLSKQ